MIELDEFRPQQTFAHIRSLLATSPELEVILTASRTDPQLILEAFRVGVKEFLPQPLTRQEVEPALARFEERFKGRTSGMEGKSGRVVCVIGARGGVGASTVAANLAVSLQQTAPKEPVVLVDLDMHGGDLGLFLDLHAAQGLQHLSKDISRLDETIVRSSLLTHSSGLHFLASGYEGFDDTGASPGSTMRVLGLLRSMHRNVLVDCGHVLEPAVKEALECSDQIIVVTTLSLPAIRRTKRLLHTLATAHHSAGKMALVVNRYMSDQKDLLSETEEMLGLRVAGQIPNDYETARESIDHGRPLASMAPKTGLGQWYRREIDHLLVEKSAVNGTSSGKETNKKRSFLGRYLSGLGLEARRKPSIV